MKCFELDGAEVAEGAVPAAGVVEPFDPFEDRGGQLGLAVPVVSVEELALHRGPERL